MARLATAGTSRELQLRRELHRRGLRFRVDRAVPVPGLGRRRCDIVFAPRRVAVFVDGCFWHSCPVHATAPKANSGWWAAKLARNVERDRDTDAKLAEAGWAVIRVWEHEIALEAAERIEQVVRSQPPARRIRTVRPKP